MPDRRHGEGSSCVLACDFFGQARERGVRLAPLMSPEEVKALRQELGCTARELAAALEVPADTFASWERGELFPTKRHVDAMEELRRKGPSGVPRRRRKGAPASPLQALADPALWRLVRKLLVHADLRGATEKLAEAYSDPADDAP
jgi:transcriptional regulator with XRE-family HTH domain